MRHERFSGLHLIFKVGAVTGTVLWVACIMAVVFPSAVGAQEQAVQNIPEIEIPEIDIPVSQDSLPPDVPDQGTPVFLRARKSVDALMRTYIFGEWITFEEQVADDFPERMVFLFETQTAGMQRVPNDFQFFINTVNETKDVLSVSFSWIKKHMNWDDPNDTKAEGKCEFVFQKTSQGLLLKNVIGDYPF